MYTSEQMTMVNYFDNCEYVSQIKRLKQASIGLSWCNSKHKGNHYQCITLWTCSPPCCLSPIITHRQSPHLHCHWKTTGEILDTAIIHIWRYADDCSEICCKTHLILEICSNKILDAPATDYAELNASARSQNRAWLPLLSGLADWMRYKICVLCKHLNKPGIPDFCTLVSLVLF